MEEKLTEEERGIILYWFLSCQDFNKYEKKKCDQTGCEIATQCMRLREKLKIDEE